MSTLKRFRLILGADEADGTGESLSEQEKQMDAALGALYEFERKQRFDYNSAKGKGGSGASQPVIARWLGDIRRYFPDSVVEVMQHDAMRHPVLQKQLLLDPEVLEQAVPDVNLVATLLELGRLMPDETRDSARLVVKKVVDSLMQKLQQQTAQAIRGALQRSARQRRPRLSEVDWHSTIKRNLKHYQPEYRTIIPETLVGYGRKIRRPLKDVWMLIDQSGSMGTSVVYSGVFASVLASLPGVNTRLVAFDTSVTDLTEHLNDPVDLLFGIQLGGGTDIAQALRYAQAHIERPSDTVLILISDLYEGSDNSAFRKRVEALKNMGLQMVCLLALSDDGAPGYDRENAQFLANLNIPAFACTPEFFPNMMAAALEGREIPKQTQQ